MLQTIMIRSQPIFIIRTLLFQPKPIQNLVNQQNPVISSIFYRSLFKSTPSHQNLTPLDPENNNPENEKEGPDAALAVAEEPSPPGRGSGSFGRSVNRAYLKDRTKVIPVDVSIRYLKSPAYKESYGDNLVWVLYRRNFSGQFAPKKTRKTCIRKGALTTGNSCPICRDEYLVLHPENLELLKQFISPFNGEILSYQKTGICQVQHQKLLVAVKQAKDRGLLTFDVAFREYDYSEYEKLYESYKTEKNNENVMS